MTALTLQFSVHHPCGAGHFPGNPIIPGALLLDEVLSCIASDLGFDSCVWRVTSTKFTQFVRPGDTVHINYTLATNCEVRFECAVSDNKVMTGIASSHQIAESFSS